RSQQGEELPLRDVEAHLVDRAHPLLGARVDELLDQVAYLDGRSAHLASLRIVTPRASLADEDPYLVPRREEELLALRALLGEEEALLRLGARVDAGVLGQLGVD